MVFRFVFIRANIFFLKLKNILTKINISVSNLKVRELDLSTHTHQFDAHYGKIWFEWPLRYRFFIQGNKFASQSFRVVQYSKNFCPGTGSKTCPDLGFCPKKLNIEKKIFVFIFLSKADPNIKFKNGPKTKSFHILQNFIISRSE